MPELTTSIEYMRAYAGALGERILQEISRVTSVDDRISSNPTVCERVPAQAVAIMGVAKRWQNRRVRQGCGRVRTGTT